MKSGYINPEVMILAIASEDVLTASSVRLDQGEYGMPDLFGVEEG